MKPYARGERVSVQIQVAITELLSKKMQDPRMEMATISSVKVTSDLRIADVYITVFGDKKKISEALKGFKKSKGFIKKRIAPKLGLRFMPELRFFHDDSFDEAARMDELIKNAINQPSQTDLSDPDSLDLDLSDSDSLDIDLSDSDSLDPESSNKE